MASTQFEANNPASMGADDSGEGLDFVGFLRRRKSFVILMAAIGVGAGYLLFQRQLPQFRSDAWIQVIHRNSDPRLMTMMAEKDLSDADYVIRSEKVLEAAYDDHLEKEKLSTFGGLEREEAVALMKEMLSTKNLSSAVVQISCTGSDPGDVRVIANAVAEEYKALQLDNYTTASDNLAKLLRSAKDDIQGKLQEAEKEYNEFARKSGLMTGGGNPHRVRAQAAQEQVSSLELQRAQLKAELSELKHALDTKGSREAILLLVNKQTANTATGKASGDAIESTVTNARTMAEALFPLLMKEASLKTKLGKDHPELAAIKLQIDLTRQHLQELSGMREAELSELKGKDEEPVQDFLTVYLQSLDQELRILERQQNDLKLFAEAEEELARGLMNEENTERSLKNNIDRLSRLFDSTVLQINEIEIHSDMGGVTAQILAPAKHGILVFPVLAQFLGLGGFLGGFVGLVIGYLVEAADRSFRKPEDVIREFGVPIVGHIPFISDTRLKSVPQGTQLDRTVVSVHLPRSRPSEAYRSVRTAIYFSPLGGSHRLIQVTSPVAGDGKSTLAVNLATSMAQSGKRTLLVESDFRRPKVHKLTGVSNKVGIVDVLRGTAEVADAVQTTKVPDFFVMPCGARPRDPAELLSRPQYEQLLLLLKDSYDIVVIDTPPVLAVTDPCSVAPRVDGVVICMRLSRHTRELGRRALEQLRDVGANMAGIVINGVDERDGYGYGNYRYSDYRHYYKSYRTGYGDNYVRDDYVPEGQAADLIGANSASDADEAG